MAASRHLGYGETGNSAIRSAVPENHTLDQTRSRSDDPFQRYGHLKFSKMAANRHLGFGATRNRSIWSPIPENPTWDQTRSWSDDPFQRYRHLNFPKSTIREDHLDIPHIVLKYQLIPTRTAGEEAFSKRRQSDRTTDKQIDTSTDNKVRYGSALTNQ